MPASPTSRCSFDVGLSADASSRSSSSHSGAAASSTPHVPPPEARRERQRDPLAELPYPPFPLNDNGLSSEAEVRLTWWRTQRTVASVRGLVSGGLKDLDDVPKLGLGREAWDKAAPRQKALVREFWGLHAPRASWGSITDGRTALRRLGAATISDYGSSGKGRRVQTNQPGAGPPVRGDVWP